VKLLLAVAFGLAGLAQAQYNISCGSFNGSIYQFSSTDINGTRINFADYKDHVLMFANVASF